MHPRTGWLVVYVERDAAYPRRRVRHTVGVVHTPPDQFASDSLPVLPQLLVEGPEMLRREVQE